MSLLWRPFWQQPLRTMTPSLRCPLYATAHHLGSCMGHVNGQQTGLQKRYLGAKMSDPFTRALDFSIGMINRGQLSTRAQVQLGKYRETGNPMFLEESVRLFQKALDATPRDHPNRAMYLVNLGTVLMLSASETEDTSSLLDAVGMLREAVRVTSPGHRYWAGYLANLGDALNLLFDQTGDPGLLEEAVQAQRDALAATSRLTPRRTGRLLRLGINLWTLFQQNGDPETLAEAIQTIRDAVAATPGPSAARASRNMILGRCLNDLFEETGDPAVLAESVEAHREAVAAMPTDHMQRSQLLGGLATALMTLHEYNEDAAVLSEARDAWAAVANSDSAPPSMRVMAYWGLGWVATLARDAPTALAAYEDAISVLPQVAPRWLASHDRRRQLSRTGGLASTAASAAVTVGRPGRAIELLEQARGVLLGEAMGARGDLTELQALDPALAAEFERLRNEIDAADNASPDPFDHAKESALQESVDSGTGGRTGAHDEARRAADQRRHLAMKWEELLTQIRVLPGLGRFLQPVSIERLQAQASEGPVVFLNVSDYRCDALILTADASQPVHVVALPSVTRAEVVRQARALDTAVEASLAAFPAERLQGQQELSAILAWLWDEVTQPVLEELDFSSAPGPSQKWPRLWWVPVGEMALLPLHAAGYHNDVGKTACGEPPGTCAVLDRAISSYTPTIRALQYARQNHRTIPSGKRPDGALVVAMPETPGAPALPGTQAEADLLARLLPASSVLTGAGATRQAVLAALPNHRIAHMSCHGLSDRGNPASSRLLLHDHAASPLTVKSISNLRLTDAELAFLSACNTSDTSRALVNEAVHITAAFQLAGYQNVIGTLWPVLDDVATLVTNDFYTRLTNNGTHMMQQIEAAQILHNTVRELRKRYPNDPAAWAGFVHAGI